MTESKGGVPIPPTVDELLERSDGELGAFVVAQMSIGPRPPNFAALGLVIKAGACSNPKGRENLALALRRGRR